MDSGSRVERTRLEAGGISDNLLGSPALFLASMTKLSQSINANFHPNENFLGQTCKLVVRFNCVVERRALVA